MTSLTIKNTRVFDGSRVGMPSSVGIVDGIIVNSDEMPTDELLDAEGATLLPGLMDGHVHIDKRAQAATLAQWGVTTAFDMGAKDPAVIGGLRGESGVAFIQSAGFPAGPPTGTHILRLGYPAGIGISDAQKASEWVAERITEGSDYIKVLLEAPNPVQPHPLDLNIATALVDAAHAAGLQVIVHTTTADTVLMAVTAGADAVTHTPLAGEFDDSFARQLLDAGTVAVPTLSMMQAISTDWPFPVRPPGVAFEHALASVAILHRAGVTIVAGTDANADPATPAQVPHGESLHTELALMVRAGLSPVEALQAATSNTAAFFGLTDRGAIRNGMRADLLLVGGDPTADIAATRDIRGVWIAGDRVR